jgi:tetratricopeptide (TPR) repeat protein
VQELLETLAGPTEVEAAAQIIVEQIPPEDRDDFCTELTVRGGESARELIRAVAARAMRPERLAVPAHMVPAAPARSDRAPEPAARLLAEAVAQAPDDAAAHSALGLCLLEAGQLDRAGWHLDRAAALAQHVAVHHWNLAAWAARGARLGRCYLALCAYREQPDHSPARAEVARDFVARYEEAVASEHPRVDPQAFARGEAIFSSAYADLIEGRVREAAEGFLRLLRKVPSHYPSWANLGAAYAELGMTAEAVSCLERALSLNPNHGPAQRRLAALRE